MFGNRRPWPMLGLLVCGLAVSACAVANAIDPDAGVMTGPPADTWAKPVGGGDNSATGTAGDPPAPPSQKPPEGECGVITPAGICKGAVAFWCDGGALRSQDCRALGTTCAFSAGDNGFRCDASSADDDVPGAADAAPPARRPDQGAGFPPFDAGPSDPVGGFDLGPSDPVGGLDAAGAPPADGCGDIDFLGICEGNLAVWCASGVLEQLDCQAQGTTCGWVDDTSGNYCLPAGGSPAPADAGVPAPSPDAGSTCDLGFLGECQGDMARYCIGDQLIEVDCAAQGQTCQLVSDVVGYYCMDAAAPPDNCGGVDYAGYCDGATLVWCDVGTLYHLDCSLTNQTCEFMPDVGGSYCVDPPI